MADLNGNAPASFYQRLLQLASGVVSATLQRFQDGRGNNLPMSASTSKIKVHGDLEVTGNIINENVTSFSVEGAAPDFNLTPAVDNTATIDMTETGASDQGSVSYNNATDTMSVNAGGAEVLSMDSATVTTSKVIATTGISSGLDVDVDTSINAGSSINVYDTIASSGNKITLPNSPKLGTTYTIVNSHATNTFTVGSYLVGGTINGDTNALNMPVRTSKTFVCVDATNEHWVTR